MYVCRNCHDRDLSATKCNYTYDIHCSILTESYVSKRNCEICGKIKECIVCAEYQAEILTRKHIRNYAEAKKEIEQYASM